MSDPLAQLDPRITAARPDLADAALKGRVEAAQFVEGRWLQVREECLDLRGQPNPGAGRLPQALYGEAFCVFEDEEGWAWGQLRGDGYVGYLSANGLRAPGVAPTHKVCVPRTFGYPIANIKAPVVKALPMGARIAVTDMQGMFARNDDHLFIIKAHLAPIDAKAPDFVTCAERFLHVPYLWGGKTAMGLDCSGLIQIGLDQAGIAAPRDSDMLARMAAQPLPLAADCAGLQRGDLVFWKGHIGVMQDTHRLLHANGHAMMVTSEPLVQARSRTLANGGGDITSLRRLPDVLAGH